MDRGIYAATSAGLFQMRKLEVVNNNLANVNTPGFKRQLLTSQEQSFDQTLAQQVVRSDPFAAGDHERTPAVVNMNTVTDFTPGPIKNTSNPLDVALRKPGDFFVISTPDGEQYTRAGNFTLNDAGEIITQDGFAVLGGGAPISALGPGVSVNTDGSVMAGGQQVGAFSVMRFEDPSVLERVGANRFRLPSGSPAPTEVEPEVEPMALEMSNVSAISSMVDLIITQRAFQAYTKSAETIDTMNQTAIMQVGRNRA